MTYSQKQCAELFSKHNRQYRGMYADVQVMGAIAMAESGGDPRVTDNVNKDGSRDRGLWQINSKYWPELWKKYDLYDPAQNAEAAAIVWSKQAYGAWATYNSKSYEKFLPDRSLSGDLKHPLDAVKDPMADIGNSVRQTANAVPAPPA